LGHPATLELGLYEVRYTERDGQRETWQQNIQIKWKAVGVASKWRWCSVHSNCSQVQKL